MRKLELVKRTTDGLRVARRTNGKVFRIKDNNDRTIAEMTIGKTTVRMNLKNPLTDDQELVAMAEGLVFTGKSSTWTGGGVHVTEANFESVRQMLLEIIKGGTQDKKTVTDPREALDLLSSAGIDLDEELTDLLKKTLDRQDVKARIGDLRDSFDLAA